jgi:hypothetical protein
MINIIRAIQKMPLDHLDKNDQRRVMVESQKYYWDATYLFRLGADGVLRRCVPGEERVEILRKCHSGEYGEHYGRIKTQAKVWVSGFIGRRCIMIRKGTLLLVRNVKKREMYLKGMICL